MSDKSAIEWTDSTWNPVTGCTKVSPGCAHCYAEAITLRFKRGGPFLPGQSEIKLHGDRLKLPISWKAPRRIFVNSMSDLFHDEVPLDFIAEVFDIMERANHHTFQVLTKRHDRLLEVYEELPWPPNVWMGVSVENQYWADRRIPNLIQVPAAVRFLSAEPLLKALTLSSYLKDIDWVIVGGESGPRARPVEEKWVLDIRDECVANDVPFFFKQWGGKTSKSGGRMLNGEYCDGLPSHTTLTKNREDFSLATAKSNLGN